MLEVRITNPSILKIALDVVVEITYVDLSPNQTDSLRRLINQLPFTGSPSPIVLSNDQVIDLVLCIRLFYQSRSFPWIREYLTHSIRDLERQLLNQNTIKR